MKIPILTARAKVLVYYKKIESVLSVMKNSKDFFEEKQKYFYNFRCVHFLLLKLVSLLPRWNIFIKSESIYETESD